MIVAGRPVGWWCAPPAWIVPGTYIHVRLGFIGLLVLSPLILSVVTFALAIWLAKLAVVILVLFFTAVMEIANAVEAWSMRHADESGEE